ncbi:DNA repair protein RecN [Tabrizicola sp. YIM 78059]|uniref:DNA repair protein RecN n=1 Tax=Tabrizicola sp. YIM 78059 TaxID=2529861 RepID=UPI0010AA7ECC|nr:DNA repair protein RecN [Tabrizicola sp. YIM 78059]
MLRALEIRDVLIIDRLSLDLGPGLNVLTGETGAGKSILLDALGFVLGWRGRAELVRAGATQGEVTAVFDLAPGHAAHAVLNEAGIDVDDELILRRVNTADGRKTAWINDRRVSGEVLRDLSDHLVELHGQHDDRGLLNPRGHRALLDAFAGLDLAPLRAAWAAQREARAALAEGEAAMARAAADEDFLRHAVAELDRLNPEPGEEAGLDARRRLMQGAARIREDVARALVALSEEGAEGRMRDALRWLDGAADKAEGRLDAAMEALNRALIELGEAQAGVENALEALDFDPGELERVEERLFAIRALARKHGVLPDDLGTFAEDLRRRLAAIDGGAAGIARLERTAREAEAAYAAEAARVTAARRAAAVRLDAAMAAELAPLKMERATFRTEIAAGEPGPEGVDAVTFTVATNPGAPTGPLNRIASGGELSRFLLALKVCLTGDTPGQTLIFDEIDRGVGGATADAVGRRLKALAAGAQVLVVTHSPQVAAFGTRHWRVEKRVAGDQTLSSVTALPEEERVEEIARMLAGDTVTEAARAAARALLAG